MVWIVRIVKFVEMVMIVEMVKFVGMVINVKIGMSAMNVRAFEIYADCRRV